MYITAVIVTVRGNFKSCLMPLKAERDNKPIKLIIKTVADQFHGGLAGLCYDACVVARSKLLHFIVKDIEQKIHQENTFNAAMLVMNRKLLGVAPSPF